MTPISRTETSRLQGRGLRRARGFTLLELLVVLTVIALALGLTMPNLMSGDRGSFRSEVRRAVATLTYARRAAIVEATPWTASMQTLDPEAPDYLERKETLELDAEAPAVTRWQSEAVTLGFQLDENDASDATDDAEFTFFPQGGSTGGILTLSRDTQSARVRVDPITGRIATAYGSEEFDDVSR
jgi:general secretion pathway protein H